MGIKQHRLALLGILVLIPLVMVGGILFLTKDERAAAPTTETRDNKLPEAVDIVYTGYGFSPDEFGLAVGATVTIINESSKDLEFASDPYPTNAENPEMNIGRIAPGESKSFQVTKAGLWGYHNNLEPTEHGRLVVPRGD